MAFGTILGDSQAWLTAESPLRAVPTNRLGTALKEKKPAMSGVTAACQENKPTFYVLPNSCCKINTEGNDLQSKSNKFGVSALQRQK